MGLLHSHLLVLVWKVPGYTTISYVRKLRASEGCGLLSVHVGHMVQKPSLASGSETL